MMKKRICALALSAAAFLGGCALAEQTLPSNDVFSPGMIRLSERMAQQPAVTAEAEFSVEDAFYARDLSVLGSMLEGTTFRYEDLGEGEKLTIARGEEILGEYALSGNVLTAGDRHAQIALPQGEAGQELMRIAAGAASLQGVPVLEKVKLSVVADWLEAFKAGDELAFGWRIAEPIVLGHTMNEDGTRLARVDFEAGSIARGEEAPYVITGYMRQPLGTAPKDSFELVLRQDDSNYLELSYSAQRKQTVTTKNKKGEVTVRTQLNAVGKIAGNSISSRLKVNMTNVWTADGEALNERVTISTTLSHSDKTPGREAQRLNDAELSLRQVIRMTTHDAGDEQISLSGEVTAEAIMDDQTFLAGKADLDMIVGGSKGSGAAVIGEDSEAAELEEMLHDAARDLAKAVYPHLSENARKKTAAGL